MNEVVVADPPTKCQLLSKVQEVICSGCVDLLEEFIEHILSMAMDPNMEVRKTVIGFMEQIW